MHRCNSCLLSYEDLIVFKSHLIDYKGDNELINRVKPYILNKNYNVCPICSNSEALEIKGKEKDFLIEFKKQIDYDYPFITTANFNSVKKHFGLINLSQQLFVKKGWGFEQWIWNNNDYCGKYLFFEKDKKCSYHYHLEKDEVLTISSGKILMKYSYSTDITKAMSVVLNTGDSFHVTPKLNHQMIALENSTIIEFSTHHKEEDSYRIEKGD